MFTYISDIISHEVNGEQLCPLVIVFNYLDYDTSCVMKSYAILHPKSSGRIDRIL